MSVFVIGGTLNQGGAWKGREMTRTQIMDGGARWVAALVAVAALLLLLPPHVSAQSAGLLQGDVPDEGAALLVVTADASPGDIDEALGDAGCDAVTIAVTSRGDWLVYVPGAPAFVNADFPESLDAGTAISVLCEPGEGGSEVASTEVIVYQADPPPSGVTAEQADCFSESLAAVGRPDAWRCMVENTIYDPCFALDETHLMCRPNPIVDDIGTYIEVTEPLTEGTATETPENEQVWLFVLADGTYCTPLTGTSMVVDDVRVNYSCSNGESVLGYPQEGEPWTAELGVPTPSPSGPPTLVDRHTVSIATVWR